MVTFPSVSGWPDDIGELPDRLHAKNDAGFLFAKRHGQNGAASVRR